MSLKTCASCRPFFDHFLKGKDNELKTWPKVTVEVRERHSIGTFRAETEWPLARTHYTPLYLDADGAMQHKPAPVATSVGYDATPGGTDRAVSISSLINRSSSPATSS